MKKSYILYLLARDSKPVEITMENSVRFVVDKHAVSDTPQSRLSHILVRLDSDPDKTYLTERAFLDTLAEPGSTVPVGFVYMPYRDLDQQQQKLVATIVANEPAKLKLYKYQEDVCLSQQ